MKWKPLSKAPKDGKLLLGWFPNGKRGPYWEKIFWGKPYDDKAFNTALLLRAIFCSGDVTHCYIDGFTASTDVRLYGNVDGWLDDTMGTFKTASEAVKEAQAIGCPMWKRTK